MINDVVSGLIVVVIAGWLGLGGRKSSGGNIDNGKNPIKKWKWFVAISWAMIIFGIYLVGLNNGSIKNIQENNIYAVVGFDLLGIGFVLLLASRFFVWINSR